MAAKDNGTMSSVATREPRTSVTAGISPDRIRIAEQLCSGGYYQQAADICESMFADDRVSKCLVRLQSATTLPLTFKLPGKDDKQSAAAPECIALDEDWCKILPESTLATITRWLRIFRISISHVDGWKLDETTGRVLPIVTPWSPRNLRNDPVEGWQAYISEGGTSYAYGGTWKAITAGDGEWLVFIDGHDYRSPYSAPWRGIARWWLLGKLYAPIDWASSSERHGQGREYVTNTLTGSSMDADLGEVLNKTQRDKVAKDLAEMGRNGVTVLPRGWKSELITDGANTHATFAKQVDYANMAIDIGLLGTNLTTEVNGGSYSAAQVHASIDAGIMRGLLELLSTQLREQLIVYWARYNGGAWVAPYPHWDTTPPGDKKAIAEAREADARALKSYRDSGAQLNQKSWFEGRVELLATASEEFPAAPAPTVPAPAAQPKKALVMAASTETAFERGRSYTDELEANMVALAAKGLMPSVAAIVEAVEGAESYEDAKARIAAAYAKLRAPTKLVQDTERALVMAQLAGSETVEQEFVTGE